VFDSDDLSCIFDCFELCVGVVYLMVPIFLYEIVCWVYQKKYLL